MQALGCSVADFVRVDGHGLHATGLRAYRLQASPVRCGATMRTVVPRGTSYCGVSDMTARGRASF